MKPKVYTCKYVCSSDIAPSWALKEDFWVEVSEGAPFTWGDNSRSMVTATAFASWCQEVLDDTPKIRKWLQEIYELGDMYIDLEN